MIDKRKLEDIAIAAGVKLSLRSRAERFIRQCAPHHRDREWHKLIEEFLSAPPPEVVAPQSYDTSFEQVRSDGPSNGGKGD